MKDLFDECAQDLSRYGYTTKKFEDLGATVSTLKIENKRDEENFGFDMGEYIIISCPNLFLLKEKFIEGASNLLNQNFSRFLKEKGIDKNSRILIVGLGNPEILSDALGAKVVEKIYSTAYKKDNNIFKFTPNIFMNTGVTSFEMTLMLVEAFNIEAVILIDSFASTSISRIATTIQINNSGLTPASAVNRLGQKISKETLHVPCFSIGVPLMIFAKDLNKDIKTDMLLEPKDIKSNVETLSEIIANTLNDILKLKKV